MHAVACGRGDPGRHRTGFVDALLEDLPVLGFLVIEQLVAVFRFVELAERRIDRHLAEQGLHAEGARLIGDDGHDVFADHGVFEHLREHFDETHRR